MKEQCRHFKEQIEAYLAGDLPPEDKRILEEHVSSCEACRRELEAEQKILGLFQSLEKHPAPEALRTGVMEQIHKTAAPRKTLLQSLDRIFSLPRIRVLTGAVAALLLVFWGIRMFHPPDRTEKPAPVDLDRREKFRGDYSYNREAKGLEERKAGSPAADTLRYEKKDMGQASAELRDNKEKIMASPPASQAQYGIMKNEKAGFAAPSVEERLKVIGAVQIKKLDESRGVQYAFFISQQDFDNMQNNTSLKNIRILKVRDRMEQNYNISPSRSAQVQEAMPLMEAEPAKPEMKAKAARSEISPPGSDPAGPSPKQVFSAPSAALSGAIIPSPTPEQLFSMMQGTRTRTLDGEIKSKKAIEWALDKSSPTTLTLEEKRRSLGLTSHDALLYVEIEVEPLK